MSKKKRVLSLILCFVMVFSLLTVIPATSVTPEASADAWTSMDRTNKGESSIKLESGVGHSGGWNDAEYLPTTYYMSPGDTVTISRNSGTVQEYKIISGPGTLTRHGDTATYTATNTGNVKVGVKVKVGLVNYYGAVNIKVIDKCTLSYNLNGGSGTFNAIDQFKGKNVTISSSKPSFTGYTFQYWQGSDGKTYQPEKSVTLNSNLKLTAVWKQNDYNPTLLRDVLSAANNNVPDEDKINYSIKTLKANLFDYDADVFNGYYMNHNTTPAQDFFQFRGGGESIFFSTLSDGIGEGIHYGKNTVAKQNILNSTLTNNLPTMRYGLNVDLFNPNDSTVKTVYKDVSMEFIQYGNCYYYSSYLNHMQYNKAAKMLELYADNLSLGMSGTDENYNVGNFWPFSNISYSLDNSAGVVSGVSTVPGYAECSGSGEAKAKNYISGWSEYVGQITTPIYANRAMETTTEGNLTNHHFGLSMETQFYMPNSRTVDGTSTGDGMKFEFSGDDDLWVFIDDYLVLDIGGGHKALYGYIDFKNDEVYVSNAVTVTGANTNAGDEGPKTKKISDINSSLLDGGMHYMRIFYLERHGGASNCCIKFNLPVVPIPSVTVQNQVADQSGELLSSESDTFTYYLQNENGTGLVNKTYTVGNAEFKTGTGGKFTLAANQFATFTDIGPNTNVKVVQAQPTNVTNPAKYDGVKIDFIGDTTEYGTKGTNYTSGTYLMGEGSVNRYVFTNYVKEYDLSTSGEHAILTPAAEHYVYSASNKTEVSIAPESGYIITAITVDGTAYNTAQVVAAAKAGKITVDHMSSHSIKVVAEKSDTDKITVIDFGLPVKVSSLYDVVGLSATAPSVATITGGTDSCEFTANKVELSYGKASIDAENNKNVDYTPTAVLQSKDTFYTAYKAATGFRYTQVDIIPAADVYYEDSFVDFATGQYKDANEETKQWTDWTPVGEGYTGEIHSGDKNNVYGYDETYGQYTEYSLGTAKQVTVKGDETAKASFTFTGTGFEIYSACTAQQGGAVISVYKDDVRVGMKKLVATVSSGEYWQTPVYMQNLEYGTYRVDVEVAYSGALDPANADGVRSGSVTFILDGVRIYNTSDTYNDKYAADEQNARFISVRKQLLTKDSFNEGTTVGAVFIDGNGTDTAIETANVADYKNFGPKNEVYLAKNQAVAFKVNNYNGESLQLGMKAANLKASTVNVNGQTIELAGSTAMYYKITSSNGMVVITNSGDGLVSITNLKISGAGIDTAAVPRGLSVDNDVVSYAASVMMAIREEPAPSEEPQPTEEPTPTEEPEPTEDPDPAPTDEPDEGDDDDGGKTVTVWEKLINAAKRLNEAIKSFVSKLFGR